MHFNILTFFELDATLIGSIYHECLDFFLLLSKRHLAKVLKEYMKFYNTSRPHQGIDQQRPIEPRSLPQLRKKSWFFQSWEVFIIYIKEPPDVVGNELKPGRMTVVAKTGGIKKQTS
jgi:hypothetical protein